MNRRYYPLIAISLANLCFYNTWDSLVYGLETPYYTVSRAAAWANLLAIYLDVALLAALFLLGGECMARTRSAAIRNIGRAAFLMTLLLPLNSIRQHVAQLHFGSGCPLKVVGVALLGAAALAGIVRFWRPVRRAAVVLVLLASPFILLTTIAVGRSYLQWRTAVPSLGIQRDAPLRARVTRRVVWIVFDEMDQRLAFNRRPATVRLPEFDRLRSEAIYGDHVYPPADDTLNSMPSLISGRFIHDARPNGPSDLLVRVDGATKPLPWSALPSIFSDAHGRGYRSAIVGWYHPYCRVLTGSIADCEWQPYSLFMAGDGIGRRMLAQFLYLHESLPILGAPMELLERFGIDLNHDTRREREREFQRLLDTARRYVSDPELDLVLVHLPVPHDPGIYDAARGALSATPRHDWYLDNLALADRALGILRAAMGDSGAWDRTVLLVSSDHSWRNPEGLPRDHRVPFLLHLPRLAGGVKLEYPINSVISARLLMAFLTGQETTAEDAVALLRAAAIPDNLHQAGAGRVSSSP